jgi:hypothetical protein
MPKEVSALHEDHERILQSVCAGTYNKPKSKANVANILVKALFISGMISFGSNVYTALHGHQIDFDLIVNCCLFLICAYLLLFCDVKMEIK